MFQLILTIVLCCVALCSGQMGDCNGTSFSEFTNKTRPRTMRTGPMEFSGINPGNSARAVFKRSDNELFTLETLVAYFGNAKDIKLHAVTRDETRDEVLKWVNFTDTVPRKFHGFEMKRLVINVESSNKSDVATLYVSDLVGCHQADSFQDEGSGHGV